MSKGSMMDRFRVGQTVVFQYGGGRKGDGRKGYTHTGITLKLIASGKNGQAKIHGHDGLGILYRKLQHVQGDVK